MTKKVSPRKCRGVRRGERLANCPGAGRYNAFTLIELVLVVGIITVLGALVLSTVGYVRKKSLRARAETEIAAISAALEDYKADNGIYVRDPTANTATDKLNAKTDGNPMPNPMPPNLSGATYPQTSLVLYRALSGDRNLDGVVNATDENFNIDGTSLIPPLAQLPKSYFAFKPTSLLRADMSNPPSSSNPVTAIQDPFGNSYGYSTANQVNSGQGYNPTFDLWSTTGLTGNPPLSGTDAITPQWIKNW
jgi:type II secretory pathway pseudopilin PulG